jgi:hypothetical protein
VQFTGEREVERAVVPPGQGVEAGAADNRVLPRGKRHQIVQTVVTDQADGQPPGRGRHGGRGPV